jgi:uncharacterized protein YjbI with pentapeptide repeats
MVDINFSQYNYSDYNFIAYKNVDIIYDNINGSLRVISTQSETTPGVIIGKPFQIIANDNYKICIDAERVSGNPFIYTGINQTIADRKYIYERNIYSYVIHLGYNTELSPGVLLSQNKQGDSVIIYSFIIKKINDELYVKLAEPDVIKSTKSFNSLITFDTGITTNNIINLSNDLSIGCDDKNKNVVIDNNVIFKSDLSVSNNGIKISGNSINNCANIASNTQNISFGNSRLYNIDVAGINNAVISTAKVINADINTAKVTNADISTAKVINADISTAKVTNADINTAKVINADISTAKVINADINTAKVTNADINTAKVTNADISTAKVTNADINTAKVTNADINTAKVTNADINTAKVTNADINTAKVINADINTAGITTLNFPTVSVSSVDTPSRLRIIDPNNNLIYGYLYDTYYNKPPLDVYTTPVAINKSFSDVLIANNGTILYFNYHSYKFNKFILSITNLEIVVNIINVGQSSDWIKIYYWLSSGNPDEITNKIWYSIRPIPGEVVYSNNLLNNLLCYTTIVSPTVNLMYSVENLSDHEVSFSKVIISGLLESTIPHSPYVDIL